MRSETGIAYFVRYGITLLWVSEPSLHLRVVISRDYSYLRSRGKPRNPSDGGPNDSPSLDRLETLAEAMFHAL